MQGEPLVRMIDAGFAEEGVDLIQQIGFVHDQRIKWRVPIETEMSALGPCQGERQEAGVAAPGKA